MAIIPTSGEFVKVPAGGADNRFVVTLTPTAEDYSGTMDKTPAEIFAAWNDGKEICFYIKDRATIPVSIISDTDLSVQFFGYIVFPGNPGKFVVLVTDPLGANYATHIYQLTPMGT